MKEITIKRIAENDDGVFGVIIDTVTPFALTVEKPWLNNMKNISCIPEGEYACVKTTYYKRGYDTFEVTGVPDRTRILIHTGNTEDDSQGCIIIAEEFGYLNKKIAILSSKKGFDEFMRRMEGLDRFLLKVEKHY